MSVTSSLHHGRPAPSIVHIGGREVKPAAPSCVGSGVGFPEQDVVDGGAGEFVTIGVTYDRTTMRMNDTVRVDVAVTMNTPDSRSETAIIDLGIPPGFSVETQDLDALITEGIAFSGESEGPIIERYELTGRQILLYISNLSFDFSLNFDYRLRAKFPLIAKTPLSAVYDYYNPQINGEQAPVVLVVEPSSQ